MFSALVKAFTGRAGFLSSLLALSIIALISAAVLLGLPRIEQNLENSAQIVLSENLADGDSLVSLGVDGRQLLLEGEFEDAAGLSAKLNTIEGVRSVLINGEALAAVIVALDGPVDVVVVSAPESAEQSAVTTQKAEISNDTVADSAVIITNDIAIDAGNSTANTDSTGEALEASGVTAAEESISAEDETLVATGEPLAQLASEASTGDQKVADEQGLDESSLSLRYDGIRLSLSGHLADEQMAQLIAERVAYVIPPYSELEINLDGDGKGSPLNWMKEFLAAVSGLPDDAQGLIEGSDKLGVQIIPDIEQTLTAPAPEPVPAPDSESQDTDSTDSRSASLDEEALSEAAPAVVVLQSELGDESLDAKMPVSSVAEQVPDVMAPVVAGPDVQNVPTVIQPGKYIIELNSRIAGQQLFASGEYKIGEPLAAELDQLAEMMQQHPYLLLRVVGNLDFSVAPREAEYVGIDRAREIRGYLTAQGIERFRVFVTPLPRDRAFDKHVQLVFYISE
jgi:outer membrane protein OmpA-like peptidoglycan-associated protein